MKGYLTAVWAESLKARRSKILVVSLAVFAFIGLMMGVMVLLARHPELVGRGSLAASKASFLGQGEWKDYLAVLNQVMAMLGMIGYGFVTSWIFGREFSDRTVKDILSLPTSRSSQVWAKLTIASFWSVSLTLVFIAAAMIMGFVVGLPGGASALFLGYLRSFLVIALLSLILITPIAFFAGWGRGYLLPIGVIILLVIFTNFLVTALPEVSAYIPWAVPALLGGVAGPDKAHAGTVSLIILLATGALGAVGTLAWWRAADQT